MSMRSSPVRFLILPSGAFFFRTLFWRRIARAGASICQCSSATCRSSLDFRTLHPARSTTGRHFSSPGIAPTTSARSMSRRSGNASREQRSFGLPTPGTGSMHSSLARSSKRSNHSCNGRSWGGRRQSVRASVDLLEFLQRGECLRSGRFRAPLRPICPGDLADVNIAARIHREAVRRDELAGGGSADLVTEAADELSTVVDDAHSRSEIRNVAIDRLRRAEFANVADRLMGMGHVEPARAVQVVPLRLVSSVTVKDLNAMVLAVRDIDPAVRVAADIMHDVELTLAAARLTPGHQ